MSAVTAPLKRGRSNPVTPRRRHLRVVEERRPRHLVSYAVLTFVLLAGVIFGAVTLNALAASAAVQAAELDARVSAAEREYAQLVADVGELEDPGRIREAATELGMVREGPSRHVALERNLPADGAVAPGERVGAGPDPLKPLLSIEP